MRQPSIRGDRSDRIRGWVYFVLRGAIYVGVAMCIWAMMMLAVGLRWPWNTALKIVLGLGVLAAAGVLTDRVDDVLAGRFRSLMRCRGGGSTAERERGRRGGDR